MGLFTTGDVSELTGLSQKELRTWRELCIAVPAEGVAGRGDHCRYDLMTTVGLGVAAELRRNLRGCSTKGVREVVGAFAAMTEEELVAELKAGRTHFAMPHEGRPMLGGRASTGPTSKRFTNESSANLPRLRPAPMTAE